MKLISIYQYADIIEATLIIRRYPKDNRWTASFDNCEVKEGGVLTSARGEGKYAITAVIDYVKEIKGKALVKGAYSDHR